MSYGQWTPNWRTWRNWETSNGRNWQTEATSTARNWPTRIAPPPPPPLVRNWQTEATSTARNWQTRMAPPPSPPVRNWQTVMAPPPPPPVRNWQTVMAPPPPPPVRNWQTVMAPPPPPPPPPPRGWNQQNAMARRDGWRTGDIYRFAERNWHIGPNNNNSRNWQTRQNRRERNWQTPTNRGEWIWQIPPNRRRRAWNWETESLPWTSRLTQQEDYIPFFPLGLALPPPFDPWRPSEDRIPLLLTGPKRSLQEAMEIQERFLMQLPALEELPRSTEAEHSEALQQLKKTAYNPRSKRDSDNVGEDVHGKEKEKDQETGDSDNVGEDVHGKEKETMPETEACTVCLEDFKAEEEVMLTPCNHMFHEDCIVPWVKSHAQCPICRLQFATLPMNSNQP